MDVTERAAKIKLLLMDCDGVLTDGMLYFGHSGEELKPFYVRDGQGLVLFHAAGFKSGIVSGRSTPIVEMRARQLGIEFVRQGILDKAGTCNEITRGLGLSGEEVAWIGDDTPDIEVFEHVGLAVAVGDGHKDAKSAAHYVTEASGGRGAVREVIDLIMQAQGKK
jgi:3-deoxy-D-manno-octulosonate 8-phosphate phosphatase (KDO 8-P phosphatase)